MRIAVSVEEIEMDNEYRGTIPGVRVGCEECGEHVEVFGTGMASIRRGCAMLREQCDGQNFYFYDGED